MFLGIHFQYSMPYIYDYSMPQWTHQKFPNLFSAVVNSTHVTQPPWYFITDIMSKAGLSFKSFSKHSKYGKGMSVVIRLKVLLELLLEKFFELYTYSGTLH